MKKREIWQGDLTKERKGFASAIESAQQDEMLSASAVIDRIKEVFGCDSDAELAWVMATTRQNIWKWRNRNSVPYREATFLAEWGTVSLDYLLMGRGPIQSRSTFGRGDYELLHAVLAKAMESTKGTVQLTPMLALNIAKIYEQAERKITQLIEKDFDILRTGYSDVQAQVLAEIDFFQEEE